MGCAASSGVVFDSICSHGNQIGNCKECLRIEQHAKLDPSGRLRHQFDRWDTDRDGKLTLDELHDGLVNDMVEQDDIVGLFEVMDRNHDGTVSLDEYLMHKARTTLLQQSVCFIREKSLRDLKRIPRRGSDTHFKHPLTGRHNDNVHWPCSQLEASASKICYVFVSHKWLRPAFPAPPHNGRDGHPDDSDNNKCKLIIAALDNLRKGPHPPVPADHQFAIWIDYSCLDQDNREYQNFDEVFQLIIKRCDIVLTPIVDPDWNSWGKETPKKLPAGGWLKAYQAAGWQQYLNRGWCRVEMMLNAAFGVDTPEDRAKSFNGKLKLSLIAGRRPHVIFGTREMAQQSPPLFLDPVKHDTCEVFAPAKGPVTDEAGGPSPDLELGHVVHIIGLKGPEGARYNDTCGKLVRYNDVKGRWDVKVASAFAYENPQLTANCISLPGSYLAPVSVDRARIVTFEHIARRHWPKQETGWVLNDRWNYDGKNADKEDVGYGKRIYKDGRVYEGECRGSHPDGIGRMIETNGEVFAGQYSAGKKEGTGTYVFSSGAVYEGEWSRDVQHGFGCYTWPDGELDRSQYANGAKTGEGVRLSADRSKAWILTQGKKGKSISLKEAKKVELACHSMSYRKK